MSAFQRITHGTCAEPLCWKQGSSVSSRGQTRANVWQTNEVAAQCGKLATELSWQRSASKVANLQLPHLHLTYPTCVWRLRWGDTVWALPRFSVSDNKSPWAIVWCCLRDPIFNRFNRLVTDGWTDGRTDGRSYRQTDTRRQLNTRAIAAGRRAGKN